MFNITNHPGNARKNHRDITSYLFKWLLLKRQKIANVGRNLEKREHLHTVGRNVNWAGILKNSMEVPQKIKNRTSIWSSDFTSGYTSEGNENTNSERCMHPDVHWSIVYLSQVMKTTDVPNNGWTGKDVIYRYRHVYAHTYIIYMMEYYSASEKNEILLFEKKKMDGLWVCYVKWNMSGRQKSCIISLISEFF